MAQPVPFSSFPKFLDEESDHFLLTMAKIDMEIDELSQKLKKHREKIKNDKLDSSFSKTPRELFDIVKERLRNISQKTRALSRPRDSNLETLNSTTYDFFFEKYDDVNSLKQKIKQKEQKKSALSNEEIKRVVERYKADNDNEIGLLHIVKCLVGEKSKDYRNLTQTKK